jgi:CelD/BcsL family acetyltransferase involved in cellulose biosynthesis
VPIAVRTVDSAAQLAALEPSWEALQRDAAVTSIFASFDWQKHWWDHYGGGRPLRLLVARAGDAIVGLLPLYIDTLTLLGRRVRVLRLVGCGGDTSPDDLGPVLAAARTEEIARALSDALLALPGWDVAWLTDLDSRHGFTGALRDGARRTRLPSAGGRSERITFAALPATYDDWLRTLHRDRRQRIKSMRKKLLAAHPDARHLVWRDAATLDVAIDRLVELHTKRWQRAGSAHSFSSPEYVGFHRAVMHATLARDRLRLHCLELSGKIVAMYYFYKFRDATYLMQSGFDPDASDVRPGQVLLGYVVEHAIGERLAVLDFLRGDHRYKEELANGERETVWVTIYRRRPGAAIYFTRRVLLPALKARVTRALERVRKR